MTEQVEKLTPEDGKSLDIEAQNIEQLKQLFPDVFREGKVDFEVLKAVLGEHIEDADERYNFTWHGKNKARQLAQTPSTGTLRPCKEESVNWDTTQNLFIEGDNLEVLKLLQKSYNKKVKMIYIDPPYNTGKDFVYKDDFQNNLANYKEITSQVDKDGFNKSNNPETSGKYHTDWLNMIYPRLKLARNLLKDDGIIFISIDDHEAKNLIQVCDEVFGVENFIEQFIWKSGRTSSSVYTREHEYIIAYAKNTNILNHIKYSGPDSKITDRAIKKIGVKNPASEIKFKQGIRFEGEDKVFPSVFGDKEVIEITQGIFECKDGKLANDVTVKAGWTMKNQIESWLSGQETYDTKGQKVTEFFFKTNGVLQYVKERGTEHPKTIINDYTTKQGGIEVGAILSEGVFDYPKPTGLIQFLMKIVSEDEIVMDFFAGSGSTAHAVLKQNQEDEKNRKFITVQLPEPINSSEKAAHSYCKEKGLSPKISSLTQKRIFEVCKTYPDAGFKSFKLDTSNIKPWDATFDTVEDMVDQSVDSIKAKRSEYDVLFEILLKYGLDLTYPISEHDIKGKRVFDVAFGSLIVCLDNKITNETIVGIGELKKELDSESTRVVIKDAGYEDSCEKLNAIETLKQYGITDVKCI